MARSTGPARGFHQSAKRTLVELGLVLFGLLLILLGVRSCASWLVDAAVASLPASVDAAVGETGAKSMRSQYGSGAQPDPSQQERVQRVFDELCAALSPHERDVLANPRVTLLVDEQVNAFALPGGEVFVLTGLLDRVAEDDALLRGVLAHELGHAVRRHGMRSIARHAATSLVIGWIVGDADEMTATLIGSASELDRLSYSRDMETEADDFGVSLLERAGHDLDGLARFLESLEAAPVPELLSTHPDSAERARAIRQRTIAR